MSPVDYIVMSLQKRFEGVIHQICARKVFDDFLRKKTLDLKCVMQHTVNCVKSIAYQTVLNFWETERDPI